MSSDDTLKTKENNLEAQAAARREINIKKRPRGRPKQKEIKAKTAGSRGKVGRPKGDSTIINEYKARMLASPKSIKVLETIFNAALDDNHKSQSAAWKLVMDRILPVGAFEREVIKDAGRSAIQINITGVGSTEILGSTEDGSTIEGELVEE